jgi:hypothetical protein
MLAVLISLFLGGISFQAEEIPGLRVGPVKTLTGEPVLNFRQADLDGDGLIDLLFNDQAAFQRQGGFPPEARKPLPAFPEPPLLDVWDGLLYARSKDRLMTYRWAEQGWVVVLDQALSWPESSEIPGMDRIAPGIQPSARLQRFLYDLDGDNIPEIIAVNEEGIHLYRARLQDGRTEYAKAGCLRVFPPLELAHPPEARLWPQEERRIFFPARQSDCRFYFNVDSLSVITRQDTPDAQYVYRKKIYELTVNRAGEFEAGTPVEQVSHEIPSHLRPCRLNDNGNLDFAGGRRVMSETSAYPMVLFETWATLDGGQSFEIRRAPTIQQVQPHCSFLDFNGNGRMDMVIESACIYEGGARETIEALLTRRVIEHKIEVFPQTDQGFGKTPLFQARLTIGLQRPPFRDDPLFQRYQAAELIDLSGDFNGDGRRDLAAQIRDDRLAIYLSSPDASTAGRPDYLLTIPREARFGIADIDGDGRSDIVLHWPAAAGEDKTSVLFSRRATP